MDTDAINKVRASTALCNCEVQGRTLLGEKVCKRTGLERVLKIEYAVCIMWRVRLLSALRGGLMHANTEYAAKLTRECMMGEGSWFRDERAGERKRWKGRAWEGAFRFRGGVFFTGDSTFGHERYVHVGTVHVTIGFFVTRVPKLLCALCAPETRLDLQRKVI